MELEYDDSGTTDDLNTALQTFYSTILKRFFSFVSFVFSPVPPTHIFCELKQQHFTTYDITTVKWFPVLPELGLSFSAEWKFRFFSRPRGLKIS